MFLTNGLGAYFSLSKLYGKKIINIVLIMVFLTQILPVRQVSQLVFGSQLTETIQQDDIDDAAKEIFKNANKSEFLANAYEGVTQYYTQLSQPITDLQVIFPHNHSTAIHTPPPNC